MVQGVAEYTVRCAHPMFGVYAGSLTGRGVNTIKLFVSMSCQSRIGAARALSTMTPSSTL